MHVNDPTSHRPLVQQPMAQVQKHACPQGNLQHDQPARTGNDYADVVTAHMTTDHMLNMQSLREQQQQQQQQMSLGQQLRRVRGTGAPASAHAALCHRHLEANRQHITCRPTANNHILYTNACIEEPISSTEGCMPAEISASFEKAIVRRNTERTKVCAALITARSPKQLCGEFKRDTDSGYARLSGVRQDAPSPPAIGSCTSS